MARPFMIDPAVRALFARASHRVGAADAIDSLIEVTNSAIYNFTPVGEDRIKSAMGNHITIEKDISGNSLTITRFNDSKLHWTVNVFLDEDLIRITAPPEILQPLREMDNSPPQEFKSTDDIYVMSYRAKSDAHHEIAEYYNRETRQLDAVEFIAPLEDYEEVLTIFWDQLMEGKEQDLLRAIQEDDQKPPHKLSGHTPK